MEVNQNCPKQVWMNDTLHQGYEHQFWFQKDLIEVYYVLLN